MHVYVDVCVYVYVVRRSLEGLRPAGTNTIYEDPAQPGRFYNGKGERCDQMRRLLQAKGQKDVHSSKGRNYPNFNPGGRCANPPHVHERFGEFAKDSAPASSSVSQGPPPQPSQPAAAPGQPAAAPSPPAAARRPRHSSRAAPCQPAAAQRPRQSSRAHSAGPPPQPNRGRANRTDWHCPNRTSGDWNDWNRGWGSGWSTGWSSGRHPDRS